MEERNKEQISLDILKHVEDLSNKVNVMVGLRTKSVLRRYPITFALIVLAGVVAVSEGLKGVVESFGIFEGHPWYLLFTGLIILVVTGTIYKKLDK